MSRRRTVLGVAVVAGAVAVLAVALSSMVQATHSPANKAWVEGDDLQVMVTQVGNGATDNDDQVVLSTARAKYSNPTDLRISVTSECALWTNTVTTGDDDSEAKARVEYWLTIDGKRVAVSEEDVGNADNNTTADPDTPAGEGKVVFCNRATRMKTENIEMAGQVADSDDEDDILIRSYNRSRTANAFNWGALDIGRTYDDAVTQNGKGTLVIQLHARLAAEVVDPQASDESGETGVNAPAAMAAVGKRTIFIEPVKMANDASF